jgi:hypothetical protein
MLRPVMGMTEFLIDIAILTKQPTTGHGESVPNIHTPFFPRPILISSYHHAYVIQVLSFLEVSCFNPF